MIHLRKLVLGLICFLLTLTTGLCLSGIVSRWSDSKDFKEVAPVLTSSVAPETSSDSGQENSLPLSDLFTDGDELSYNGHTVKKMRKRVHYDGSTWVDATYAVIRKGSKSCVTLDAGIYHPLENATRFGLFSFLGKGSQQFVVSEDVPRGGKQWVVSLEPTCRVIFDGSKWGVGRESDDFGVLDLDGDGVYEITAPITDLYDLQDKMSIYQIPLPVIVFKYSPTAKIYLPANHRFPDYFLESLSDITTESDSDEYAAKSRILRLLLDYVYAGNEEKGWALFEQQYTFSDEVEVRKRVWAILRNQPVYRYMRAQRLRA